jgi:hypothetical protein
MQKCSKKHKSLRMQESQVVTSHQWPVVERISNYLLIKAAGGLASVQSVTIHVVLTVVRDKGDGKFTILRFSRRQPNAFIWF